MTDEQILELAKNCEFDFSIKWRLKGGESSNQMYWECWEQQLLKFALAIRKETIEEVLTSLKDVPNPEANKTAINRIMSMNYD
jgi:hypothetical protein